MIPKIEKLTPEQETLLPQFRSEWFTWGVSTERADRQKAEAAIMAMRASIGLTLRPMFFWFPSPAAALIAIEALKSSQWQKVVSDLSKKLLGANLRANLGANLWDNLRANLWDNLWDNLGANLRDNLWDNLRANLGDNLGAAWWGQHEAYWIAFYLFCRDIIGIRYNEKRSLQLNMWRDIAQSCCWWWCYENYVIISDRPTVCHMTEQEGRLHCPDGPALAFADGYALYSWHGVSISDDVILHPENITVARIDSEANVEVRRVLLERYGEAKYLADSNTCPVHTDKWGTLFRKEIPGDEPLVLVKVINSTPEQDGHSKAYFIRVPPTIETAHAAVAWSFGMTSNEYHPKAEA